VSKKKKDPFLEDYQKIRDEMLFEKVDDIFKNQPGNYIEALEEIGFMYYEEEDFEEKEENEAVPENSNQEFLVSYFEGEEGLSERTLEVFLTERNAEHPNYPLIRRYFKEPNSRLKDLLLFGLKHYPMSAELLDDLAYYQEFENVLGELIAHYTYACLHQENLQTFTELAQDFYYATNPDGYEALYALQELFAPHTEKRKIVDFLVDEQKEAEKAVEPIEI